MTPLKSNEKTSINKKPYIMLFAIQTSLMLFTFVSILLSHFCFSKNILEIFVNETDKVEFTPASFASPLFLLGFMSVGWIIIISHGTLTTAQRDAATTWLLGGISAFLFSIASWSISALGAEDANSNLWYIAIITMVWTVISSAILALHKLAIIDEGKG